MACHVAAQQIMQASETKDMVQRLKAFPSCYMLTDDCNISVMHVSNVRHRGAKAHKACVFLQPVCKRLQTVFALPCVRLCDCRKPADIIHENPHNPGGPGISCAAYNQQMGQALLHPDWPCIYILVNKLEQLHGPGPKAYKSFPLECCWWVHTHALPAHRVYCTVCALRSTLHGGPCALLPLAVLSLILSCC
jgi:hypothetical protein